MICLHKVSKIVRLMETENRMVVSRGLDERGNGELLFQGHKVSVMLDE